MVARLCEPQWLCGATINMNIIPIYTLHDFKEPFFSQTHQKHTNESKKTFLSNDPKKIGQRSLKVLVKYTVTNKKIRPNKNGIRKKTKGIFVPVANPRDPGSPSENGNGT